MILEVITANFTLSDILGLIHKGDTCAPKVFFVL